MFINAISLKLEPGQKATLQPASWQEFEEILAQLGERRSSRIAYANGIIEIMVPLPETELDAYAALGVPEVWIYEDGKLKINVLQEDKYIESEISFTFPNLAVVNIIPQFMERATEVGVSQTLEEFEQFILCEREDPTLSKAG